MATVTFDTLKFVETLKEAGVPETQAKAFSTAVRESHQTAELATKGDIAESRHETKQDIAELRHEMRELASALRQDIADRHYEMDAKFEKTTSVFRQEISGTKFELLKWLIGLAIAQVGLLFGLLKFFLVNP